MSSQAPGVAKQGELFTAVSGVFYRAIDPQYRESALTGSRSPGRYSPAGHATLYLSASLEGVEAAMIAHRDSRTPDLEIIEVDVAAVQILDLRDSAARQAAGIRYQDAVAPWQEIVSAGGEPPSWRVRQQLDALGAHGLIDPSRKRPGLWHLALFRWNDGSGTTVRSRD